MPSRVSLLELESDLLLVQAFAGLGQVSSDQADVVQHPRPAPQHCLSGPVSDSFTRLSRSPPTSTENTKKRDGAALDRRCEPSATLVASGSTLDSAAVSGVKGMFSALLLESEKGDSDSQLLPDRTIVPNPDYEMERCLTNPRRKNVNITECVYVPSSEHVAEIVGRQGCKIKALRAKTNTYIKTPVRGESPVFVVTGRKEDVAVVKHEIISAAEHFSLIRASWKRSSSLSTGHLFSSVPTLPGQTTVQVRVPYHVVGLVVGPRGATIKRIQQQTHTYIVTPGRNQEPVFEVSGMTENVERARDEIQAYIALRTIGSESDLHHDDFLYNGTDVSIHKDHFPDDFTYSDTNVSSEPCDHGAWQMLFNTNDASSGYLHNITDLCRNSIYYDSNSSDSFYSGGMDVSWRSGTGGGNFSITDFTVANIKQSQN